MHASESRKDGWTAAEDKTLIELRSQGLAWKDISRRLGRSVDACGNRYERKVPKELRKLTHNTGVRWAPDEEARLRELMRAGLKPGEIASAMGRHVRSISNKIQYLREPRRVAVQVDTSHRVWAPPHLFEDRDRRMAAERTITSIFFGDPAPGQSALDKKQGAFA